MNKPIFPKTILKRLFFYHETADLKIGRKHKQKTFFTLLFCKSD